MVSVAGAIGGEVLKETGKKHLGGGGNALKKEKRKDIDMPKNNILLRRLPNPRRVQLPNDCVFFAKYERVNRHALAPTHVRIAGTHVQKIRPRRQRIRRFVPRNKRKKDNRLAPVST